jgi:hypothetical protein
VDDDGAALNDTCAAEVPTVNANVKRLDDVNKSRHAARIRCRRVVMVLLRLYSCRSSSSLVGAWNSLHPTRHSTDECLALKI